MVTTVNVVGSGGLKEELELRALASDIDAFSAEYDPSKYNGLYVRLNKDDPLITVYRTGKYIITGCSSQEELFSTEKSFKKQLAKLAIDNTKDTSFGIRNVVCTGSLDIEIELNSLAVFLGLESVEYEPEQFPGLIYRISDYSVVLLVFGSGKVVIVGANSKEIASSAFEEFKQILQGFIDR